MLHFLAFHIVLQEKNVTLQGFSASFAFGMGRF